MKATTLAFRLRVPIFLLLYLLGFLAPWERWAQWLRGSDGAPAGALWLSASALLARSGWLGLQTATLVITALALASLALGTALRVWGTACLGSATMRAAQLRGESIVDGGPYRFVRNPLYIGSSLLAVGTSLLMPVRGAFFFLPAELAFTFLLILVEERFLAATAGAAYRLYSSRVPRLLPRLTVPHTALAARPQWLTAVLVETYPVAFTLCFAIFAWRYNAHLLIRCLIICYGASLVVRALVRDSVKDSPLENP